MVTYPEQGIVCVSLVIIVHDNMIKSLDYNLLTETPFEESSKIINSQGVVACARN